MQNKVELVENGAWKLSVYKTWQNLFDRFGKNLVKLGNVQTYEYFLNINSLGKPILYRVELKPTVYSKAEAEEKFGIIIED